MTIGIRAGMAAALVLGGIGLPGEARGQVPVIRPEGAAEQVGQVVGGALDTAGRAVERGLRTAFARTRGAVESMEVTSRVYSRLLWDKELAGGRFVIDARPGGVVILRGSVPSRAASDRAVALAASTVGVTRVFNELIAPEGSSVVVPGPVSGPEIRATPAEPALEPLPPPGAVLEPLPSPAPTPSAEPRLEPLPRPAPAPTPEADPAPRPEPADEPLPSIRPPLPNT